MKNISVWGCHFILESGIWKEWSDFDKVRFQVFQKYSCIPFELFKELLSKILKREHWTTKDFCAEGFPKLQRRFLKRTKSEIPKLSDFRDHIPREYRRTIYTGSKKDLTVLLNKINKKDEKKKKMRRRK